MIPLLQSHRGGVDISGQDTEITCLGANTVVVSSVVVGQVYVSTEAQLFTGLDCLTYDTGLACLIHGLDCLIYDNCQDCRARLGTNRVVVSSVGQVYSMSAEDPVGHFIGRTNQIYYALTNLLCPN